MFVCTLLVLFMQVGFLLLENGQVRRKNSVNIAMKNLADLALSLILFWAFGFALIFAPWQWVELQSWLFFTGSNAALDLTFLYQMMFAGTAATIVSGAVAERMMFRGYLLLVLIMAALIYPVVAHWVWGGSVGWVSSTPGWLAAMGYVDLAGATVVHAVGGWVALAAVLVIGPRTGRFAAGIEPLKGQNQPLAAAGVIILFIGWVGFNGGSVTGFGDSTVRVVSNTLLAGLAGATSGLLWSWWYKGSPQLLPALNGLLAGLVSVTAMAHAVYFSQVVIVAVIGAVLANWAAVLLARRGVDDVVGAVSVHAVAGSWGAIAVALFADPALLATGLSFWRQLGVQSLGVLVIAAWSFGLSFILLAWLHRLWPMRVLIVAERSGLDHDEHGERSGSADLLRSMEARTSVQAADAVVTMDPLSDLAEIAAQYNDLLDEANQARQQLMHANRDLEARVQERTASLSAEIKQREIIQLDLEKAKEQALQAATAKTEFLATMSHEIRTPMNGMVGMLEVLKQSPLSAEQIELLQVATGSSEALLQIIDDILDYSKIEAGQLHLESVPFSPYKLVDQVARLLATKVRDQGLELVLDVGPEVPNKVMGDPLRWQQVLVNLVGNAVKFTEQGYILVQVRSQLVAEQQVELSLRVTDTGVGIDKKTQRSLFEPFVQADSSTTRRFGGTGLGLSICRRLIAMMGGDIGVKSEFGHGAEFWVQVVTDVAEPAQEVDVDLSGLTVLLIDDNRASQVVLANHLRWAGAEVISWPSGQRSLAQLQANPQLHFDLALVDQEMGDMTGLDLAKALGDVESWEQRPALLMTSYDMLGIEQVAQKLGYQGCLQKPLLRGRLLRAVGRVLGRVEAESFEQESLHNKLRYRAVDEDRAEARGALILVAEDNPVNARVIETMMRQLGFVVHIVGNGREAWNELQQRTYGLLITDCHMPVLDGYQLAQKIRRQEAHQGWYLPIIALTASAMESDARRCAEVGMDDYLTKPVTLQTLNDMVVKHLPVVDELRELQAEETVALPAEVTVKSADVIDEAMIRLTFGDDQAVMTEMLQLFIDTTLPLVRQVHEAMLQQQWSEVASAVHQMVGAAGAAGARQLAADGKLLEQLIRDEDWPLATVAMQKLPLTFDKTSQALRALM